KCRIQNHAGIVDAIDSFPRGQGLDGSAADTASGKLGLKQPETRPIVRAVTPMIAYRRFCRGILVAALVCLAFCVTARAAEPRVDLEVVTEPGFLPTEARAWSEMLTQAG